ncbi:hypothetical protein M2140_001926 [Clostridiales Family XIII bacterium PM5-7]
MIQIPRIPESLKTVEEACREFNNILAQIQDQINRDLNTIEVEMEEIRQA